jgi:Phosphotransferase enzyme family
MNDTERVAIEHLTSSAGIGRVREVVPLAGGANNRAYRVEAESCEVFLKAYFRHPDDPRDRLAAEFAFARFAWASGVRCIPEPLACDPVAGLGLFEFAHGRRPTECSDAMIAQAVEFVSDLNASRWRPLAARLPAASEACFSIAEHLGTVARRVDRLTNIADPDAAEFVRNELLPMWEEVHASAVSEASDNGLSLDQPLDLTTRCVSPSDFGFHNALIESKGRVRFLDFEYAGWDDPAKLICDFFCQPAVPVTLRFFEPFARAVADCFPDPAAVLARARLLLPVYCMKWVCIRLNEFLPAGARRRAFSLSVDEREARKARQLSAARAALHHIERAAA